MKRIPLFLGALSIVFGALGMTPGIASASGRAHRKDRKASHFKLVHPGTLTVAVSPTPPAFDIASTGKVTGITATVLRHFAHKHHLKITFDKYSFSGMLTAVESGRADISGGFFYTKTRAKAVYYVDATTQSYVWMALQKSTPYKKPSTLLGKPVGSAAGYAQTPYIQKYLGQKDVSLFTSVVAGAEAVKTGRVDAFVGGNTLVALIHGTHTLKVVRLMPHQFDLPKTIAITSASMVVSCKNPGLAKAVDATLVQLRKRPKLTKLFKKYDLPKSTYPKSMITHHQLCGK